MFNYLTEVRFLPLVEGFLVVAVGDWWASALPSAYTVWLGVCSVAATTFPVDSILNSLP